MAVLKLKAITDQLRAKELLVECYGGGNNNCNNNGNSTAFGSAVSDLIFSGVSTDTRTIQPGELFVALQGETFDGHSFIETAIERGAAGIICRHWPESAQTELKGLQTEPKGLQTEPIVIRVTDTLAAYQQLAVIARLQLKAPVIAITGSVGKTSTRGLIAACLNSRLKVHQTEANLNNEIGLPATILAAPDTAEVVVVELGMRAAGEIRLLSDIARPDIAVITNIGHSHIEFLGSQQGILAAKMEIISGLAKDGLLILNCDDPLLRQAGRELIAAGTCRVGFVSAQGPCEEPGAELCLYASRIEPTDSAVAFDANLQTESVRLETQQETAVRVTIPAPGRHQVINGLFGLICARALGLTAAEAAEGAARYQNTGSRQRIQRIDTLTVLDDSYNASPESMAAALQTLQALAAPGNNRKLAALGGMLELGGFSAEAHTRVGRAAAAAGLTELFLIGDNAEDMARGAREVAPELSIHICPDIDTLIGLMLPTLHDYDFILIKGSRAFRMEQVLNALEATASARGLNGDYTNMNACADRSVDYN